MHLVRQIRCPRPSCLCRRCPKTNSLRHFLREWRLNTQTDAAALRLGTPLSSIARLYVSALTARTSSFSLLASSGKAPCGQRTTLARYISSPPAYIHIASRVAEAIRVEIWSVAAYMHMARGLAWSIQRPAQGWHLKEEGIRSSTAGCGCRDTNCDLPLQRGRLRERFGLRRDHDHLLSTVSSFTQFIFQTSLLTNGLHQDISQVCSRVIHAHLQSSLFLFQDNLSPESVRVSPVFHQLLCASPYLRYRHVLPSRELHHVGRYTIHDHLRHRPLHNLG